MRQLNILIFGLSITSSWGNGHATTFRSLIKALAKRGHSITFFEQDAPWYAANRDMPESPFCKTVLYTSFKDLREYDVDIAHADLVILGSYVKNARDIANRVVALEPACFAFYDIDTPVTLAKLEREDYEYLHPDMIPQFDLYFSFTGGPILQKLEIQWRARRARALYCSVDPELYYPSAKDTFDYTLGYLGTYSEDRQASVQRLLIDAAQECPQQQFCVAGAQYPDDIAWTHNIRRIDHIPPQQHRDFYNAQRFTLNVTRQDMIQAGYSPSVRLFEAGACGTPVITDYWEGLDEFFTQGEEILVAHNTSDVIEHLAMNEHARNEVGERMRQKVLKLHTSEHRAMEVEQHWLDAVSAAASAAYSNG